MSLSKHNNPSPPSTPLLRTFLTDGTTAMARRHSGGGTPPSDHSNYNSLLPALSLSQPVHASYPGSAPSSPQLNHSAHHASSRPVSPSLLDMDSSHTLHNDSSTSSSASSAASLSHVLLHVRRSYNALGAGSESDSDMPTAAAAATSSAHSSPPLDGSGHTSARDRNSLQRTPQLTASWVAGRREGGGGSGTGMGGGASNKAANHSSPSFSASAAASPSVSHVDGAHHRSSASWWLPSGLLAYLQRVRKHYTKPEDRSRPVLSTSSLAACIPTLSTSAAIDAGRGGGAHRSFVRLSIVLLFVASLYYVLLSGAPPLSFLYWFYFSASISTSSIYQHSPPAPTAATSSSPSLTLVALVDLPPSPSFLDPSTGVSPSPGAVFRWHCLMSWSLAVGPSSLLVYVDSSAVCDWLVDRPELRGLKCYVVPDVHVTYRRPVLPALFEHAHSVAGSELIAFMARPAFVHPLLPTIVRNVSDNLPLGFMMVTRRTDVSLPATALSSWTFSRFSSSSAPFVVPQQPAYRDNYRHLMAPYVSTLEAVVEYAGGYGKLHGEYGIDLFVYRRSVFAALDFPPYLAGVYRWDNWLLSEMILDDSVVVVDASSTQLPLLIFDTVAGAEEQPDPSQQYYNDRITKIRSGNQYKLGHANNADVRLDGSWPHTQLVPNSQQSIAVLLAKRINRHQYLAVLHFEHSMDDALHVDLLHNWLCWAKRVQFAHFVLLVRDSRLAAHLKQYGVPIIAQDTAALPSTATASATATAAAGEDSTADFATFHVRVLHSVLKAGYHFLTGSATAIFLDDPLLHLNRGMDVQASVNATSDALTSSSYWAVSATTYGRDFIARIKDCLARTGKQVAVGRVSPMSCVAEVWRTKNKNLKRAALDDTRFVMARSFFKDKRPQRAGVSAVAIDLTDMLHANNTYALTSALHDWHMSINTNAHSKQLAHSVAASPSQQQQCAPPLYPAVTPAPSYDSISAASAFSLKIKVMASFRPRSLAALLRSLQSASYDDDQVELELCVDGLPAVSPTDKEKAKHAEVRKIIDEFAWTQGPLTVTEERESKKGPGETGDWKGKGAFGAFLSSWQPSSTNPHQVLLLLPEYVVVSPVYYQYVKLLVTHYYLDRQHYDSRMYGISLQSAMPILGTDYDVAEELPTDLQLYRYQAMGSLATVFFPQHWSAFQRWLANKRYNTEHGMLMSLSLLDAFANATSSSALAAHNLSSPCVPTLASNAWWLAWNDKYNRPVASNVTLQFAIDHLYPLFFTRWLWETGYYALFPRLPDTQLLIQQSDEDRVRTVYAWSTEKDKAIKAAQAEGGGGDKSRLASQLPLHSSLLPGLHQLPLFDVQGWDVNGNLHQSADKDKPAQPDGDDGSKQYSPDDKQLPALESAAAEVDVSAAVAPLDVTSMSMHISSISRVNSRQRSAVMPYRPLQYSHTSQCSIVRRDKKREQQREQHMLMAHTGSSNQQQQQQQQSKRSKGGTAAASHTAPAASEGKQQQHSPAKKSSSENDGEEEEAIKEVQRVVRATWK